MRQVDRSLGDFKASATSDPVKAMGIPDITNATLDNAFKAFGAEECAKNA
jgi:hypothetical protein